MERPISHAIPFDVSAKKIADELMLALEASVKLQSHYAKLLNGYDGGKRMVFNSVEDWLERLRSIKIEQVPYNKTK